MKCPRSFPLLLAVSLALSTGAVGTRGNDLDPSTGLTCSRTKEGILLQWNFAFLVPIQAFVVVRDQEEITKLPSDATSYLDSSAPAGTRGYTLRTINADGTLSDLASCEVAGSSSVRCRSDGFTVLVSWDPLATASPLPIVYGLTRDGEIVARTAGLEARDTVPGPGTHTYQVVATTNLEIGLPAEPPDFLLGSCSVTIPGDTVPPPRELNCRVLDLTPGPLEGAGDIFPIPVGAVSLTWINPVAYAKISIARAGIEITRLEGSASSYLDFEAPPGPNAYSVTGIDQEGRSSTPALCTVEVGGGKVPPIFNLQCFTDQPDGGIPGGVVLTWENGAPYEKIRITRDNEVIFEDTGALLKYIDRSPEPGVPTYCVVGSQGGIESRPTCCQVVVGGDTPRDLLYFSRTIGPEPAIADPLVLPPFPGNRITCLADNSKPLQAWSFGVASDPTFVVPRSADTAGTDTERLAPDFLSVEILADGAGVTCAVVIQTEPTPGAKIRELEAGRGHSLLNLVYGAGPRGVPGLTVPVKYTDALGSPPVQVLFVVDGLDVVPATLPGWVSLPGNKFLRGDANGDGRVDMSDARFALDYLFLGGRKPGCLEAANANGSTLLNIADPVYLLNHLFLGGPAPPFPYPTCAEAAAPLGCDDSGPCLVPGPLER